jgi:C1A family cysteine protease
LKELERVKTHNKLNLSWKEGINKFSALTQVEKDQIFGGRSKTVAASYAASKKKNAHTLPQNFELKAAQELPKSVDWRSKRIDTSVKDQGSCGSCWAFAATTVIESHVALKTGFLFYLSAQEVFCNK